MCLQDIDVVDGVSLKESKYQSVNLPKVANHSLFILFALWSIYPTVDNLLFLPILKVFCNGPQLLPRRISAIICTVLSRLWVPMVVET